MYSVTDNELNAIRDSGLSATIDIALFTMCFGIFVALIVVLSTVEISDAKVFGAYVGTAIFSGILSLWFGVRAVVAWQSAKKKLKEIKGAS